MQEQFLESPIARTTATNRGSPHITFLDSVDKIFRSSEKQPPVLSGSIAFFHGDNAIVYL
jgi:hypothetical protein